MLFIIVAILNYCSAYIEVLTLDCYIQMDFNLLKLYFLLLIILAVMSGLFLNYITKTSVSYSGLSGLVGEKDMYRVQPLPPCSIPNNNTTALPPCSLPNNNTTALPPCSIPNNNTTDLPPCSIPNNNTIEDAIYVNLTYPIWTDLYSHVHTNLPGGHHRPSDCVPEQKLAILIPYRDRDQHLRGFLQHIHPFLQRQLVEYRIFVIELAQGIPFNRGSLFNIGYKEATKLDSFDCFFFHDVDLLPENNSNTYMCSTSPKHFSTAQSNFAYKLPYPSFFGGVSAMPGHLFEKVNGYSNLYFGWGGEDDDIEKRIHVSNMSIVRNSVVTGRYRQMPHIKAGYVYDPTTLLQTSTARYTKDGLNSIKYELLNSTSHTLVTWIKVYINETELCAPWPYARCGLGKQNTP